jgi:hypothetical protein
MTTPPPSAGPSLVLKRASNVALEPTIGSSATPPKTIREVLGRAYMLRGSIVWTHGASEILGLVARIQPSGVDVRDVLELTAVAPNATGTTVGAFAAISVFAAVLADNSTASESVAAVRLRLELSGARLTVVRDGVLATISVDAYKSESLLLPVSFEIPSLARGIGMAERRRATADGAASYELSVTTALRISQLHRFEDVRIFVSLDGVVQRATEAEALLDSHRFGIGALAEAARVSAHAIESNDARTSAAARAVAPLVLAALRESVAIAKPKDEEPRRRLFGKPKKKKR